MTDVYYSSEGIGKLGLVCILGLLFILQPGIASVSGASDAFLEDFNSTIYRDDGNTNATGWGEGDLQLPYRQLEVSSQYTISAGAKDICIKGDYAFLAAGKDGLIILNISNPRYPTFVAQNDFDGDALSVDVDGNFAYLIDFDNAGFVVINITDINNPDIVATKFVGLYPHVIDVEGDAVYIGTINDAFYVFDIANPSIPIFIKYLPTGDAVEDIEVDGDYAYLATSSVGLLVINVTDPSEAHIIASFSTTTGAYGLDIEGDCAYLADQSYGLFVLNITNPKYPGIIDTTRTYTLGFSENVHVDGDFAYITCGPYLEVFNITNPKDTIYIDRCQIPFGTPLSSVIVDGEYAYVAASYSGQGLTVIRISGFIIPVELGACSTTHQAVSVWASGNFAYVADYLGGLQIINISDSKNPEVVGSYINVTLPELAYDACTAGDFAFIASGQAGLHIVNISDPINPFYVSNVDIAAARGIQIAGNMAYIAGGGAGIVVVNITDPCHPSIVGTHTTLDFATDVRVSGNLAFVADLSEGLMIFNITNPSNPTPIASCNTSAYAYNLWISGNYAYITDSQDGLVVINIASPYHPVIIESIAPSGLFTFSDVVVEGDLAFVTATGYGIHIYNISNPGSLEYLGTGPDLVAWKMVIRGGIAFVACYAEGFRILEVMRPVWRQYAKLAVAESTVITDTVPDLLLRVNLTADATIPGSSEISYYISADDGAHWEETQSKTIHSFEYLGTELRWKAILESSDYTETPVLSSISLEYWTMIEAPDLDTPSEDYSTNDNTPTFEWTSVEEASQYLLQLDVVNEFNSLSLRNISVFDTTYTMSAPLSDGFWYWRVAGNDSWGDLGHFSEIRSIFIDSTTPSWDQQPMDLMAEFGQEFRYDANATDANGIAGYAINDTVNFEVDSNGIITSILPLSMREYGLEISAADPYGNEISNSFTITVVDSSNPTWDESISGLEFECGFEKVRFDFNASDVSGISYYWINDTYHFYIGEDGVLTNITFLDVGTYGLEIRAFDPYGYYASAIVNISIIDTSPPSWDSEPVDQFIEEGSTVSYQLHAKDFSEIDRWWVNDTDRFTITASGNLVNIQILNAGNYALLIRVYDIHENYAECEIIIHVQEETTTTTISTETTTTSTTDTDTSTTGNLPPDDTVFLIAALVVGSIGIIVVIIAIYLLRGRQIK